MRTYETPTAELLRFAAADILTSSTLEPGGEDTPGGTIVSGGGDGGQTGNPSSVIDKNT